MALKLPSSSPWKPQARAGGAPAPQSRSNGAAVETALRGVGGYMAVSRSLGRHGVTILNQNWKVSSRLMKSAIARSGVVSRSRMRRRLQPLPSAFVTILLPLAVLHLSQHGGWPRDAVDTLLAA
jgi:hypothetical protein